MVTNPRLKTGNTIPKIRSFSRHQVSGNRGFTLIEVVVAVAVLVIIAAAVTPNIIRQLDRSRVERGISEVDALTAANAGVSFALFTRGYRKTPVERFEGAFAFDDFAVLAGFALAPAEDRGRMRAGEGSSPGAVSN